MPASEWLLFPPVVFTGLLAVIGAITHLLAGLSYKRKGKGAESLCKAYACGEDLEEHRVQVDYDQFFLFAFFFTILHVVALMIATVPVETAESFFAAILYVFGAVTGLFVLFRRQ